MALKKEKWVMGWEFKVGMHHVMSTDYHSGPGVSATQLRELVTSPAHYQSWLNSPREETEDMVIGTAVHTAVLEPHLFKENYAVMPRFEAKTKTGEVAKNPWATVEGKALKAKFEDENKGKIILSPSQMETIDKCTAAVGKISAHPTWGNLLVGHREKSFYWIDKETGLQCKCRPDNLTNVGFIIDLKTVQSASEKNFQYTMAKMLYYLQAAYYLDGVKEACLQAGITDIVVPDSFVFIAVEKEAPNATNVFSLSPTAIELGRKLYRRMLNRLAECLKTNTWPGYESQWDLNRPLELPNWAYYALNE